MTLSEGHPDGELGNYEAAGIRQLYLEERLRSRVTMELSDVRVDGKLLHASGSVAGALFRLQCGYENDPDDSRCITAAFNVTLPECEDD
ncbi:hypothetical protein [Desulfonatronum thioautotrophicum]|uniref:hypothetical protein n=1 Tax=Desulfonatronum thioautotrophicum TaxID=617001 RepID=UPI0012947644|nr:hypothetical protein [Desulfonatronum thioautotrophicum]